MNAQDVMTRDVATVRADTSIATAIQLMLDRRISGLPVLDAAGRVIGVISEGDLLRRVELGTEAHQPAWLNFLRGPQREAQDYVRSHTLRVEDVMTPAPMTVAETTKLVDVVALMKRHRIRRLPVLRDGLLCGIVTRSDLVRALSVALGRQAQSPRTDQAVQADVIAAIAAEPWSHACHVAVHVADGDVHIEGVVYLDTIEAALRVAAERVDGVRGVTVRVEFVSPVAVGA